MNLSTPSLMHLTSDLAHAIWSLTAPIVGMQARPPRRMKP